MKGIIFSNYFIGIYFSILVFNSFVTLFIVPLNRIDKAHNNIEKYNTSNKHKIRSIIHLFVFMAVIISVCFLIKKYQIDAIIYVFYIFVALFYIVILPYAFGGFIHYIFIKPFDYELTETRKNILGFTGYIMLFICGIVAKSDTGVQVSQLLSNAEPFISDFFMIALLTIWYFTVVFFSLTFFLIALYDINIWVRNKIIEKNKKRTRSSHAIKDLKYASLADRIVEKIDTLPKGKVLKKLLLNIFWFLCLFIDLILGFLIALIDLSWKLINIIIFIPIKLIKKTIIIISKSLSRNQGKTVIIISRVALVTSLIIVYLIDKYKHIFTDPGSEVYEFLCSVIIIPLIITQLIELNNKQYVVERKTDQEL